MYVKDWKDMIILGIMNQYEDFSSDEDWIIYALSLLSSSYIYSSYSYSLFIY